MSVRPNYDGWRTSMPAGTDEPEPTTYTVTVGDDEAPGVYEGGDEIDVFVDGSSALGSAHLTIEDLIANVTRGLSPFQRTSLAHDLRAALARAEKTTSNRDDPHRMATAAGQLEGALRVALRVLDPS